MREKLTDRYAATAAPGLYADTDSRSPRGFLLRVTPAGGRAWCLNYRVKDSGKERRITIGDAASWPIMAARERAAELRREIDAGGDPLRRLEDRRAEPTVAELVKQFEDEALINRAPRTGAEYKAMLQRYVVPAIGAKKVSAVTGADIERLHRRISADGKKRRADAVATVASIVFTQAVKWKLIGENPCRGAVKRNSPPGRERFLKSEELNRLLATLERWRERRPDSVDALLLLLLTGSRRGEVLSMRWTDVGNLDAATWVKPAALTKQRKLHTVPLSPQTVAVLRRRLDEREVSDNVVPLRRDDHVFNGGGDAAHVNRLERTWREIRAAAGLEDLRIHDLRHSFASMLIGEGLSLPIVGSMLGHSSPTMTARYAHIANEVQRQAADLVGKIVGSRGAKATD
jgi:integrase